MSKAQNRPECRRNASLRDDAGRRTRIRPSACAGETEVFDARLFAQTSAPSASRYFAIQVIDDQTGRGVPLVELKSVSNVRYWTDSAGFVAIDDPAFMNQTIFFAVSSHGYEFAADGFGIRGK